MATRTRPKTPPVVLSDEARSFLEVGIRRQKIPQYKATRCRIILLCAEGLSNMEVARRAGVSFPTVGTWWQRFLDSGIDGLSDRPRSGRRPVYTQEAVEGVVAKTVSERPANATHWSLRLMAGETGMSHTSVWRTWGKFKLKPHRVKRFKPTTDKDAEDKIRIIFHRYRSQPENSVVLSFDQKSGIQAIDRSLPVIPMAPGCPEQRTHDYRRNGTTDLFAARDVHTGHIYARCYDRHRAVEDLDYMNWLEGELPRVIDVYIVPDNLSAHKIRAVREWFAARPRWHTCFTPTSASWTNQIERWFAELTRMVLKRGVFRSVEELVDAVHRFVDNYNRNPRPYRWLKTADEVLASIDRFHHHTASCSMQRI